MAWNQDRLAPVETLLFRSKLVKVGRFQCAADHNCFPLTESLDNDVFVLPRQSLWLRRGVGDYRFVEPGGILLHRAGSTLERRRGNELGENTYWFGVHPEVFVESLQRYELSTVSMGSAVAASPSLRYRLALFLKQLEFRTVDILSVEDSVLTLFFDVCEQRAHRQRGFRSSRSDTAARRHRVADAARAYLDSHLNETVGLDVVARAAGTSLYHLCRIFREQTGMTMHAYRTRQRLGQVLDRLIDDASSDLTELALESGFSSHSHLSRVFRQQMGTPPSSMRSACAQLLGNRLGQADVGQAADRFASDVVLRAK